MATVTPAADKISYCRICSICQTPYYVLQWVAVAKQHDTTDRDEQGARVGPPVISQLYVLVVANMFSQILVFVSSCCNPIIYGLLNENFRM